MDGAGKTTLVAGLADRLTVPVTVLREPGGVELAERVRALVKDPDLDVAPRAAALLYAAARAQLVTEELVPRLAHGGRGLLARLGAPSPASQGAGRGPGADAVRALSAFATGGVAPDRTLLLRLARDAIRARLRIRAEAPDRLEGEPDAFFAAIARAYDELAAAEPERFRVLDASAPPDAVLDAAVAALADLLP